MPELVRDPSDERRLGPNHNQVDLMLAAESKQPFAVFRPDRMAIADHGDPRVSRRGMKLVAELALGEFPGERVLTPTRPDDENFHPISVSKGSVARSAAPAVDQPRFLTHDEATSDPLTLIVQKYGGTSLGSAERVKAVARRVVETAANRRVCVVASAMGDTTDELLGLAAEVTPLPHPRELDMLLTAGERISIALLSMAIMDLGRDAISFTASQAGIVTDAAHGKARILDVRSSRVLQALDEGKVAIVAGFQGVSSELEPTTLGRGGSDTTAVALAAALEAEACEIYTDVDGVYTADPHVVPRARKLRRLSFEEMLELAASGAKVLALRSVEYARNHGLPLHVRSSFADDEGTWIGKEDEQVDRAIVSGVAHDASQAKVTILAVPDQPGVAARIFRPLAEEGANIDMIVQNVSAEGRTDVSFTLPKEDLARVEPALERVARGVGGDGVTVDAEVAKISLVGAGMKSDPGVAADMFDALAESGINIEIISTSSIRISCVVRASEVERAVRVLHDRFELSEEALSLETYPPAEDRADGRG
jgi:aspartate kinase